MAHVYVNSNAVGTGTGADKTNAYTTLAAACAAKAAGDNFWVAHVHAETQASAMTITCPGTSAAPCTIMCVDFAGTTPPVSADLRTGATIATTGAFGITISGTFAARGIIFNNSSGATGAGMVLQGTSTPNQQYATYENCALNLVGIGSAKTLQIGIYSNARSRKVRFINSAVSFGAASNYIEVQGGVFEWNDTPSAIGGTAPTVLFSTGGSLIVPARVTLRGVDLSALSGKTLVDDIAPSSVFLFHSCKVPASMTLGVAAPAVSGREVYLINCDSGATNYRTEKDCYSGAQVIETTIVRSGGASDGTTPVSWKIATTANSKWLLPFESIPLAIWNDTTGANVTVTVYGTTTGGGVPKDDELWIECSYPGSALTPISTTYSTTKADFLGASVATNNSSDGSTWGGGGAGNGFKIVAVLSGAQPAMKGPIYVTVKAAKATTTYYVDPKVVLS